MFAQPKKCAEKKTNLLKTISLSARTAAQSVEDMGNNINNQLKNKANDSGWLSLAVDASTDGSHTARLFIQGASGTEELASRNSVCGTTGENIFKELEKALI